VRESLLKLLNERLADALDLVHQSKQAHWNVKGPQFQMLHELFDDVAEHAEDYADLIAERAVALGGTAEGRVQTVAKATTLPEYPALAASGTAHLAALISAQAVFTTRVRSAIDACATAGDAATADLFTEVVREADKDLWRLEAHTQATS